MDRARRPTDDGWERPGLKMLNGVSLDLEDWYHPELVRRELGARGRTRGRARLPDRVTTSTRPILDLLARHGVRATFFVVGEVMRRHPALIRSIHRAGHEIACHGMTHRPLWTLTPASFEEELIAFEQLCRRVLGAGVELQGFRAPTFSLDRRTAWAATVLVRCGYAYDASVFPARAGLYGWPEAPTGIHALDARGAGHENGKESLLEFPPATYELARRRFPVGGGVYLRLLPSWLLIYILKRINRRRPFLIYLHPWETDPDTPHTALPAWARFATYRGIESALGKVETLLQSFRFTTVWESLTTWQGAFRGEAEHRADVAEGMARRQAPAESERLNDGCERT